MGVVMDHARCARAIWTAVEKRPGSRPFDGEWRCVGCGIVLGVQVFNGVHVLGVLLPTKTRHGEIQSWGLPDRVRLKGETSRSASFNPAKDWHGFIGPCEAPVYVYCPRVGICGKGQHLDLPK